MAADAETAIQLFKDFVRIKTNHPNPDYEASTLWLKERCTESGWQYQEHRLVPNKPVVVFTIPGSEPHLKAVALNCHVDVVPVELAKWTHDPFAAIEDSEGRIYGRGTQDMKCVGVQTITALRRLTAGGKQLRRTVHLVWTPDEEIGSKEGMAVFSESPDFTKLNVAVMIDEGLASPTSEYRLLYGERLVWWVKISAKGNVGHGSQFIPDTAVERLLKVVGGLSAYRAQQEALLKENPSLTLGDVTTVNVTVLQAGVGSGDNWNINVIPGDCFACVDIRVPPAKFEEMGTKLRDWVSTEGLELEYKTYTPYIGPSDTSDSNPWWGRITSTFKDLDISFRKEIFPAATDSRFLRAKDVLAYGFSPMNNTPVLLHDHNEYLHRDVFLHGIGIYERLIADLANLPASERAP